MKTLIVTLTMASLIASSLLPTAAATVKTPTLRIAEKGVSKATIVVAADADKPEQHAAAELATILAQVTGGKFATASKLQPGTNLCVGTGAAKLADAKFTTAGLDTDGMVIRTTGRNLILAGGAPRGTLYAVYSFLEDHVGCHWWSPKASTIPKKPTLAINSINRRYVPTFEHRDIMITSSSNDPDWSVRNKCVGELNGYGHFDIMPERGGVRKQHPPGHSYFYVMPPDKYFATHPEWYSLIEGERRTTPGDHASLCLTNEAMATTFATNLLSEIRNAPTMYASAAPHYAGWIAKTPKPFVFASVTPPDDSGYPDHCQCANCQAIEREEGSPAGLMLRFANRMAREVKTEFPYMAVTTFAYHYNQKPPKITRPDPNVVVYYCPINASFSKPLTDKRNRRWLDDFKGWLKISKRVYLYDYPDNVTYEQVPHPNLDVIAANIKFSAANGVKGYFGDGMNGKNGSEMAELRAWLIAKLLWDPSQDPNALIKQFTNGYYGPAGKHIVGYLDVMHKAVADSGDWLELSSPPTARFLSAESLLQGWAHLKTAQDAVKDNPELLSRVKVAQLPTLFVVLVRWNELKGTALNRGSAWPFAGERQGVIDEFMQIARENGVTLGGTTMAEIAKAGTVRSVRD